MKPGCWVVVFVSRRSGADAEGYGAMAARMEQLARAQPGFIGMHSVRGEDGVGITVCYWQSADDIAAWKRDVEHAAAQQRGRERWYESYAVTIARVERRYGA
jgi:heme-degrading monooxygenase HmoA